MQQFNIYEAKTQLSRLVELASRGDSFIIIKSGKPMAKLIPFEVKGGKAFCFGTLVGKIKVNDDFDTPFLPDDLLKSD